MPRVSKKSEDKKSVESATHSVPMAERSEKVARVKVSSTIDRYRKKSPVRSTEKKQDRPVIDIDEDTKSIFVKFAASKELCDIFENDKKEITSELYGAIFEKYKDVLWETKTQPKNPSIKVNNADGSLESEGQFIVQVGSRIKINMSNVDDESECPEDVLLEDLLNVGIEESVAKRLVEDEVSFVPQWNLNFTDMLYGKSVSGKIVPASNAEISASEILFKVINGDDEDGNELNPKSRLEMLKSISEEGWVLMKQNIESHTKYFPQLIDGENFLDRVCNYAKSRDDLDAILTVFRPVYFCSRVKYACSDAPKNKNLRLINEAKSKISEKILKTS